MFTALNWVTYGYLSITCDLKSGCFSSTVLYNCFRVCQLWVAISALVLPCVVLPECLVSPVSRVIQACLVNPDCMGNQVWLACRGQKVMLVRADGKANGGFRVCQDPRDFPACLEWMVYQDSKWVVCCDRMVDVLRFTLPGVSSTVGHTITYPSHLTSPHRISFLLTSFLLSACPAIRRSHGKSGRFTARDPVCLGCNQCQGTQFRWSEVFWDEVRWGKMMWTLHSTEWVVPLLLFTL